jgi:DNA-binding response OmpR family regulator
MKILIVEDDENQMLTLTQALVKEGYIVVQAFTGHEGFVMAVNHPPALIIADQMMPGTSGLEMVQRIRANPQIPKMPVLFLSNAEISGSDREAKLASVQPAEHFLKSDMSLKDIVDKVKTILSGKK